MSHKSESRADLDRSPEWVLPILDQFLEMSSSIRVRRPNDNNYLSAYPRHWLIVLFIEAFAGYRSLHKVLISLARRMRSGCQMNQCHKHPNSAQLLRAGLTAWLLSP